MGAGDLPRRAAPSRRRSVGPSILLSQYLHGGGDQSGVQKERGINRFYCVIFLICFIIEMLPGLPGQEPHLREAYLTFQYNLYTDKI